MLAAFRHELAEAGHDSMAEMTRFFLHVEPEALEEFISQVKTMVSDLATSNEARREAGHPGYGGLFVMHRLADSEPESPS